MGGPWEQQSGGPRASRLRQRPFTAGLPAEFADAVLQGVASEDGAVLPPGTLTVDRSGFDEVESASPVFRQAGTVLRHALAATLRGRDVADAVRAVVRTW